MKNEMTFKEECELIELIEELSERCDTIFDEPADCDFILEFHEEI